MVGNFFADQARGKQWELLPEGIGRGVLLHRQMDSWTDQHPEILAAKRLLPNEAGLFRGVFIDVFVDHFVARRFEEWHGEPLAAYVKRIQPILLAGAKSHFPKAVPMIKALKRYDWLNQYAHDHGISTTLKQMGRRFPKANPLHQGGQWLTEYREDLAPHLEQFYLESIAHFGQEM